MPIGHPVFWMFLAAVAAPLLAEVPTIVVITGIGVRTKVMNPDVETARIGAALLSVLLYPTVAGVLLSGTAAPRLIADAERSA